VLWQDESGAGTGGCHGPTGRQEGDCVLYRARRDDADQSRILVLAPVAEPCGLATLRRLEYEYVVRAELDPAWAVRPLALSRSDERTIRASFSASRIQPSKLFSQPSKIENAAVLWQFTDRGEDGWPE
jgi:hypothetical protein